ncbi:hypothetical protein VTN77DRAFT_7797 [Rasamsonia byssochlamydoides]|uniref:uncharacterized protein n=1 Tax=Rasamsonia byssochlamydoides TaxID=89139 RepID=UPI0037422232
MTGSFSNQLRGVCLSVWLTNWRESLHRGSSTSAKDAPRPQQSSSCHAQGLPPGLSHRRLLSPFQSVAILSGCHPARPNSIDLIAPLLAALIPIPNLSRYP